MSKFRKIVESKLHEDISRDPLVQQLEIIHDQLDKIQETVIEKYSSANFDREGHKAEYYNESLKFLAEARSATTQAIDFVDALTEENLF